MQSVRNKLLLIETELVSRKYDVVCMSEHFLSSTEINCFNLDNYKLASYCVRDKSRGGSLILCQKELFFINREDLTKFSIENACEVSAIELPSQKMIVLSIYRTPLGDLNYFMSCLDKILDRLQSHPYEIIICGDFNVHFHTSNRDYANLLDLLNSFSYHIAITEATRKGKCLDNIITRMTRKYCTEVYEPGFSDHKAVKISVGIDKVDRTLADPLYTRPITQIGLFKFHKAIDEINWTFLKGSQVSPAHSFDTFVSFLSEKAAACFPLRNIKTKVKKHWFNESLKKNACPFEPST